MLDDLQKKVTGFLSQNSSALLTAGGVVGTVTTALLSGRAGYKIAFRLEAARAEKFVKENTQELTKKEIVLAAAPEVVPPVITGGATIGSIVFANRVSAQKAAALAAAYGMSQKQRDEYKAKLEEKLGLKKSEDARTEINKARTDENNPQKQMIIVSGGAVLCYDHFSDRYVRTTAEKIRQAEKKCKEAVEAVNECSLHMFYDELGFGRIGADDMLGWNLNNPPKIIIDTTLVNDEPCLVIDFDTLPVAGYQQDYD